MNQREFFTAIIEGNVTEEVVAFAQSRIEKLDETNAKRASKPSKKSIENEPIKNAIVEVLSNASEPMTAAEMGVAIEQTTAKASSLLTQLKNEGKVTVTEVKRKGKAKCNGYSLAKLEIA